MKVRAFPHTLCTDNSKDSQNSCVALRKPLVSEANHKKRLPFATGSIKIGLWSNEKKVMWSDASRFTLSQRHGCIRVRREAHEAMHPSCIVPTVQAYGSSVMIWGCFTWSGLGSANIVWL